MQEHAARLLSLFSGNERIFGVFGPGLVPDTQEDKKLRPSWVNWENGPITEEHWIAHLEATKGIGVVPIRDDNKVKFMAIDLDVPAMEALSLTIEDVAMLVNEHKLPFVVCRSKSGAAHIYTFFNHFIDAKKVREKIATMADFLGFRVKGTLPEIYPRTSMIGPDDKGSYINMPYFGGDATTRYGLAPDGSKMDLETFLSRAEYLQTTAKAFTGWEPPSSIDSRARDIVSKGPPCLQTLFDTGVPDGQRNTVMLQYYLLFSKAAPGEIEDLLNYVNVHSFKPPVTAREVATLVRHQAGKTYRYNCNSHCFAEVCPGKTVCQIKEFGLGGGMAFPAIKEVLQYGAGSNRFEIVLEMGRVLKVSSEELLDWKLMRNMVLHTTLQIMPQPKKGTWEPWVESLLARVRVIPLQDSFEVDALIRGVIQSYITSKTVSNRLDDLLSNRPVKVVNDKGPHIVIPHEALSKMIRDKKFVDYKDRDEFHVIVSMGAWSDNVTVKGRDISVWRVPEPSFNMKEILDSLSSDFKAEL